MGVLRPDAELVYTLSDDKRIVADMGYTIPAYSTSSKTAVANVTVGTAQSLDFDEYDYVSVMRGLAIPEYDTATPVAGRSEYTMAYGVAPILSLPANTLESLVDNAKKYGYDIHQMNSYTMKTSVYFSTATTLTKADNATTGINLTLINPDYNANNKTITYRRPTLALAGGNYLSQAAWESLVDVRYQYVEELYRIPRTTAGTNGWAHATILDHIIECVLSNTHKLT